MSESNIERDETGTAYITEADGQTRIYAIELDNDEGWALERQAVGGDESPERLSCHDTEAEALAELATFVGRPQRYEIYQDGEWVSEVETDDLDAAFDEAKANVANGEWRTPGTVRVSMALAGEKAYLRDELVTKVIDDEDAVEVWPDDTDGRQNRRWIVSRGDDTLSVHEDELEAVEAGRRAAAKAQAPLVTRDEHGQEEAQ